MTIIPSKRNPSTRHTAPPLPKDRRADCDERERGQQHNVEQIDGVSNKGKDTAQPMHVRSQCLHELSPLFLHRLLDYHHAAVGGLD